MTRKTKPTKKLGRPSSFTDAIANRICEHLAEGLSMSAACALDGMPGRRTVFRWLREKPDFRHQYARAKVFAADAMAEDLLDIADDATNDWMEGKNGPVFNAENVQRSKLRIDARKWMMAKLAPRKYGDALDINHGVQPEDPLAALLMRCMGTTLPIRHEPAND